MGLKNWLGIADKDKNGVSKLEEYQYEVIKELVKEGIEPYQLADLLGISEARAKYELNKAKNGTTNSK
jgi:predicted transcriptional regulator